MSITSTPTTSRTQSVNDNVSISELLAGNARTPEVDALLSKLEEAGIDLSNKQVSMSKIQTEMETKIRMKMNQLRSIRDLKNGTAAENEKRRKKREKIETEIVNLEISLNTLQRKTF